MYITFNKETKRVGYLNKNKPRTYTNNSILAEVKNVPEKYDYLTVTNIQEKTRIVKEAYEEVIEYDENGELLQEPLKIRHEEVTENYLTCDLVPNLIILTTEQLEIQKEKKYETLCKKYIAEKYPLEEENKVIRRYLANPTNEQYKMDFLSYNLYVENCILKASEEVYK